MKNFKTISTIDVNTVFTNTENITKEDYVEMESILPRCSQGEVLHTHPLQAVELEAIDGKLGIILPDRRLIIKPGQPFEIPKNTEHAFYNADEKPIRFKSKLKPALHTEWLAKEIVAARQRKQSKLMSMIEHSYILNQVKGEYYRSDIPVMLRKIIHPLLAGIAKFLGIHKRISPVY